jgi:hypothetical protein
MNLTGRPLYTEPAPVRDNEYREWVRSFPCVVRGCRRKSETAHVGGHGLSQKASDLCTVPICHFHHRTDNLSLHKIGRVRFEEIHGLNLLDIASRLSRKPKLRIEGDRWVASIDGEDYVLRPVHDGVKHAIRAAIALCREVRKVIRL